MSLVTFLLAGAAFWVVCALASAAWLLLDTGDYPTCEYEDDVPVGREVRR